MSSLRALYFDGRTSASGEVQIRLEATGHVVIQGPGVDLRYPLREVEIAPRVANTARTIALPNGAVCEVGDNEALDRLLPAASPLRRLQGLVHRLESRLTLVLAAVAIALLAGWAGVEHGIPWLARGIAASLPPDVDRSLGQGGLQGLDRLVFGPSQLDQAEQDRLRMRFTALAERARMRDRAELVFRASPELGANAFALPSGIVVLTDELVAAAASDEELLAVLAHELGHIHGRHMLRGVLQNAITPLVIATVTGDLASLSALAGAMPTVLLNLKYSRVFELEADGFAVELLAGAGIPARHLADILARIAADADDAGLGAYLSTHPATAERIARIERR